MTTPEEIAAQPPSELTKATRFSFWTVALLFGAAFSLLGYTTSELRYLRTWADARFVEKAVQNVQMEALSSKLDDAIRRLERIEEELRRPR